MQSHLGKDRAFNEAQAAVSRGLHASIRSRDSACKQSFLLGPVERQIEFGQTRRGEHDGLPALQDRFDQLRAQEGKVDKATDVATGNAVAPGEVLQRFTRARVRSP